VTARVGPSEQRSGNNRCPYGERFEHAPRSHRACIAGIDHCWRAGLVPGSSPGSWMAKSAFCIGICSGAIPGDCRRVAGVGSSISAQTVAGVFVSRGSNYSHGGRVSRRMGGCSFPPALPGNLANRHDRASSGVLAAASHRPGPSRKPTPAGSAGCLIHQVFRLAAAVRSRRGRPLSF
jgi:hypothetical protein